VEKPAITGYPEAIDVLAQDCNQHWWDRDDADLISRAMLETSVVVSLATVGPPFARLRTVFL
jgi:hypothetical protein